jgi:four helix bundle protein
MLSFQKLDVYRCSIEFLALSVSLPDRLPRGHAELADQLRRAALSVPLNIAEASGRTSPGETARHFTIARGSATECAAVMDVFQVLGVIDARFHASAIDLLERVVSMLTRLCRPPTT